jgi:electron transfer flavoprotein alpha subunit
MARIGVLIEARGGEVKKTSLGALAAARQDPEVEVYALLSEPNAEACQGVLRQYGADRIVSIRTQEADLSSFPELQAAALVSAIDRFHLDALLGASGQTGRDLLARIASSAGRRLFWTACMSIVPPEPSGNPTSPGRRRQPSV